MSETRKLPELVVTKGGVPFEDQAEGIRQFKEACHIASLNAGREHPPKDCISMPFDVLEQIGAESASLRAQLDEARARVKTFEMAIAQLPEMPAIMDERAARRRAIEDAANVVARSVFPLPTDAEIARDGGGIAVMRAAAMARDAIEQQIRALLSESKT